MFQILVTFALVVGAAILLVKLGSKWFGPKEESPSDREARLAALREQEEQVSSDVEVTKEILETSKTVEKKEKALDNLDQKLNQDKED